MTFTGVSLSVLDHLLSYSGSQVQHYSNMDNGPVPTYPIVSTSCYFDRQYATI